ncbi:immunoglobulin-like domain-containing protein [Paenibacillus sp. Marseille-Q7038]
MPNNNRVMIHRKQLLYLLLITAVMLLLVSCQKDVSTTGSDVNSSGFKQGKESIYTRAQIQEDEKLNLRLVEQQLQEGEAISYELLNHSGHPIFYGADLRMERKVGERWFEIYFENEAVISIGYGLDSGNSEIYPYKRSLPAGQYRLTKEVSLQDPSDSTQKESITLISDPFTIKKRADSDQEAMNKSAMFNSYTSSLIDQIEEAEGVSLGKPSTLTRSEREDIKLNLIGSEIVMCGLSEKEYLEGNVVSFRLKNNTDMTLHYGEFTGVEADIDGVWTEVHVDLNCKEPLYLLEPNKKVELDAHMTEKLPVGRYRLTKEVSLHNTSDITTQEEVVLISDPFMIRKD